jgi:aryl-alcohol dehydrogenase-like predicted oxidoreductase
MLWRVVEPEVIPLCAKHGLGQIVWRPAQVTENAQASGVRLSADLMREIDIILGPAIEADPAETGSPPTRP